MFRLDQHSFLIMGSTIITELPRVQISFPGGRGGGGGNLCGQWVKTAFENTESKPQSEIDISEEHPQTFL